MSLIFLDRSRLTSGVEIGHAIKTQITPSSGYIAHTRYINHILVYENINLLSIFLLFDYCVKIILIYFFFLMSPLTPKINARTPMTMPMIPKRI